MPRKTQTLNGWLTKGLDTVSVRLEGVTQNIKELQTEEKELRFVQKTLQRLAPTHKSSPNGNGITQKTFKRGEIQQRVLASAVRQKNATTESVARNLGLSPRNTYQALNRLVRLGHLKKHHRKDEPVTFGRA
jgi:transcriptional regulator with GAF, ATPase, and Fis domain